MNIEQKIYSSLLLDPYYDVIVSDSAAGTGKTLLAISAAMKLIDGNNNFNKIVYMRKTVNADDEEMGFLPGDESAKLAPYLAPLYSNLETIVLNKNKQKKFTQEELQSKIEDEIKKYNITPMFEGFLRGTNITSGTIVIIDEIQNETVASARTSFTRITEGCKLIVLGSNKQIDNKYVNKHTSALTYVLNQIDTAKDIYDVHVGAFKLTKTVRSRIAEWSDNFK
jgi:PhoH-like ATPase